MFDRLRIRNFQPYKETEISLCPGVSVFVGSSDVGKTSIVRAIRWLLENRPLGGAFKSWFAGKGDVTSVFLTTAEGHTIKHAREGEANYYELDGERLEAHGAEVPDGVRDALGLGPYNLSSQFDHYFLLQDSPGEVARQLNAVVRLDEIDAALKAVNGLLRKAEQELKTQRERAEELEAEVETFAYLGDVARIVEGLEKSSTELEEVEKRRDGLGQLLEQLTYTRGEIGELESWLEIEKDYEGLAGKVEEYGELSKREALIDGLLREVVEVGERVEDLGDFLEVEGRVEILSLKIDEFGVLKAHYTSLGDLLALLTDNRRKLKERREKESTLLDEYASVIEREGVCPLCFTEVDGEKIKEIVGNL